MEINEKCSRIYELVEQIRQSPVRTKTILLVGSHGSGKTQVLSKVAEDLGTTRVNLNLELGKRLNEVPEKRRAFKTPSFLDEIIDTYQNGEKPLILDNIELLFSPELELEPLSLLEDAGRQTMIIAAWPGVLQNDSLSYAEPGYKEYKTYRNFDSFTVSMEE
ncbi:MAG: BREX-3 system P-loop-containing protein BrxF [Spirochaetota bacterium]|nr:BREX-3 system P-loop-containing protein BrxF [Spirochaetota bacterium]